MPWKKETIAVQTRTLSELGIIGATALRVRVVCSNDGGGNPTSHGTSSIYEIDATGQVYGDVGIRVYDGSEVVKIGTDQLEPTHKLRVRKGGTTYGIPLLEIADTNASTVRIHDGSAVKALPKASIGG